MNEGLKILRLFSKSGFFAVNSLNLFILNLQIKLYMCSIQKIDISIFPDTSLGGRKR